MGIRIKDAQLVEQVTGKEKIPVSDGSNLPKTVSVEQLKGYIETGKVTEQTVADWGFTKNKGTVTKLVVNGEEKSPDESGVVDIGVIKTDDGTYLFNYPFTATPGNGFLFVASSELDNMLGANRIVWYDSISGKYHEAVRIAKNEAQRTISFEVDIPQKEVAFIMGGGSRTDYNITTMKCEVSSLGAKITREVAVDVPSKISEIENDLNFVSSDNLKTINGQPIVGKGDIELGGNDLIALEISEVGEVAVTYGEKSDFVDGQIRETGELVLEFNIE